MDDNTQTENHLDLARFLYRAAAFVGSKRFVAVYKREEFRFCGDASALFAKLRAAFLFQMQQSLNTAFYREHCNGTGRRVTEIRLEPAAQQIARQLHTLAKNVEGEQRISARDKKFTVPRGTELMQAVFNEFNLSVVQRACVSLHGFAPLRLSTFNERNFLSAFATFVESLNTLGTPTPYPRFERLLASLLEDIDWWVNGYPHDVLAHDICSLRETGDVAGLFLHNAYCASMPVSSKNDTVKPSDDYRFVRL